MNAGVGLAALFPFIESGATVRNLNLANVNITGTGSFIFLGTLAGENHGTISNVHILSGTVGSQTSVVAGSLVAKNEGLIENSSSAANVSVGANSIVGGFAGLNGGTILLSTSSGTITTTSESRRGARIINMSFAGPRDPSLERALKAAYDKGIVLIAAAGNAGPKSPPLFPGAIPFVIAGRQNSRARPPPLMSRYM